MMLRHTELYLFSPPFPISLVPTLFYNNKIYLVLFSYFYLIQCGLTKLLFTQILSVHLSLYKIPRHPQKSLALSAGFRIASACTQYFAGLEHDFERAM